MKIPSENERGLGIAERYGFHSDVSDGRNKEKPSVRFHTEGFVRYLRTAANRLFKVKSYGSFYFISSSWLRFLRASP